MSQSALCHWHLTTSCRLTERLFSRYPDLLLTHPRFFKVLTLLDAINLPLQTLPPGFQRHHTLSSPLILSLHLPPVLTRQLIKRVHCLRSLLPLQLHVVFRVNFSILVTSTILLCASLPNVHLQSQSQAWPLMPRSQLQGRSTGHIMAKLSSIRLKSYSVIHSINICSVLSKGWALGDGNK